MTLKNTDNNIIITIVNVQTSDGTEEKTELICEGRFYESNGKYYIFYTEDETDETAGGTIMIVVSETEVTMSRKGDFSSKMHYLPGKSEQIIYNTPYGSMIMFLKTESVENHLGIFGGVLKLVYRLSVNGEEIHNNLTLTVKNRREEKYEK